MNDIKLGVYHPNHSVSDEHTKMLKNTEMKSNNTFPHGMDPEGMHVDTAPPGEYKDNKSQKKRLKRKNWHQAWREFCENTTLHGLRQIAEPQPFLIRRLIWVLLVLAGSVLFLYQMVGGIMYYYTYPVSVNVKINYNDTITFPAFTICNQNAFRKTVTSERDWYRTLAELFAHQDPEGDEEKPLHIMPTRDKDLTIHDLFNVSGHALEDLVVGCTWDGSRCSTEDFVTRMTDYGKCYTFNARGKPRSAKRTGTEGGLQLLLNVEQYEYMPGPNQGAGLRILLHNQDDAPLVKDFGMAVPPGSYSLLGTTLIRIENLPRPHGQCDDAMKLKYYDTYTKLNCLEDCKQRYLEEHCDCIHINMVHGKGSKEPCTVDMYHSCVVDVLEHFNKDGRAECFCPIPCSVDSLELFNSIGYISSFDALNLLHSNLTKSLEPKYIKAQEVTQRVSEKVVQADNKFVKDITLATREVEVAFKEINAGLDEMERDMQDMFDTFDQRLKFHKEKGLLKVLYIMEHDFVRGWTIIEERTLPYLTFDFYEMRGSFRRAIELLYSSQNGTEQDKLIALSRWANQKNAFQERLDITVRVTDNITEVHEKYKSGEPLLTFKSSKNRRYDRTWITVELLQAIIDDEEHDQDGFYSQIFRNLDRFITSVETYIEMGDNFTTTFEPINETLWAKNDYLFRKGCVGYNYNIFLYKTRIVDGPVITINKIIEEFDVLNRTLMAARSKLHIAVVSLKESISLTENTTWKALLTVLEDAKHFATDIRKTKIELSKQMTSKEMHKNVRDLDLFFSEIRSAGRSIQEKLQDVKIASQALWSNMLNEFSTTKFYAMVHEDFVDFPNDRDFYLPYFANLLDVSTASLANVTAGELEYRMNADFNVTNNTLKHLEVDEEFQQLTNYTDIGRVLGIKDETFLFVLESYQKTLQNFLEHTHIDIDFYLTNFIQLNAFMQELSYEEILQQPAYDTLNLLGDIGGSVGLFLGASALTLAEITDVLIMQFVSLVTVR